MFTMTQCLLDHRDEEELHTDGLSERDDDFLTGSVERKAADNPDDPVHPDLQLHPDPTRPDRDLQNMVSRPINIHIKATENSKMLNK